MVGGWGWGSSCVGGAAVWRWELAQLCPVVLVVLPWRRWGEVGRLVLL